MLVADVVVALGGPFERAEAVAGDPDGRVGLLVGFGHWQHLLVLPEASVVGDLRFRPRLLDDLHRFFACGVAVVVVDAPANEFVLVGAEAGAELDAAFGEVVEGRDFLRQPHGVVERELPDHSADVNALGGGGDRRKEHGGRGDGADVGGLVLDNPVVAVAELVHQARLADVLVVGCRG